MIAIRWLRVTGLAACAAGFALLAVTQWWAHRRGYDDEAAAGDGEMLLVMIAVSLAVMVPFAL